MALDGSIYPIGPSGASVTGLQATLTDASNGTPTLVDAAIQLRIYKLDGVPKVSGGAIAPKTYTYAPASTTPSLTLAVGSGLTRELAGNLENSQVVGITITNAQALALLGSANAVACSYQWILTPANAEPVVRPIGDSNYEGVFALVREGYPIGAL
jgi:hypothetical protein